MTVLACQRPRARPSDNSNYPQLAELSIPIVIAYIPQKHKISHPLTDKKIMLPKSLSWVSGAEPNTTTCAGIRLRSPSDAKNEAFLAIRAILRQE
jgi:hypothetical protein